MFSLSHFIESDGVSPQLLGQVERNSTRAKPSPCSWTAKALRTAFFAARIAGEKGLLHGLVLAAVYVFLYLAVSLALYADADIAAVGVRTAAILLCGALGGVLGVGKKSKIRF